MINGPTQKEQILLIDDSPSFVKALLKKGNVSVKWVFDGYDVSQVSEKLAIEIIDGYKDIENYLVLINVNIKLDDTLRQDNKGINLYRVVINKLNTGSEESILLYSFISKKDLGERNVFIKILAESKFKRLPIDFQILINTL